MEKLLTISVAAYNVDNYLDQLMQSVIEADVMDALEVLIVNDGSKDGTAAKALSYQQQYPASVRLIDKENGGHGSTINCGIREAKGKYFRALDGDDWSPLDLREQRPWSDGKPPRGGAVKLFPEENLRRVLLVCSGGDVVLLPECPKCVKILRVTDKTVVDADYSGQSLTLAYGDGQRETVPVPTAGALRVSLSYAKQMGGELIDIRPEKMRQQEGPIPCTASMEPEDLDDYLETRAPDTRMYFICSFGVIADQAAGHAYRMGFQNARSVGGIHPGLHID